MTGAHAALVRLGLVLPPPPEPAANYVPWVRAAGLVYVAGQTPKIGNDLKYCGILGAELSIAEGQAAAELCALRLLSALQEAAGDLDRVARIVKLSVFVKSTPEFTAHPAVADAASRRIVAVLGDRGRHTRSTIGVAGLPGNAAVEIEIVAQIGDSPT